MTNKTLYTTLKIRLKPDNEQLNLFKQSAGLRRFTWNFSKGLSDKFYKKTGKTLKQSTLRKRITMLRNHPDYKWMKNVSCDVPKQAAKDFCKARTDKCERYGIELIIADRFYPSSQLCSSCGERKTGTDKLTLRDREYKCNYCSYHQDRDMNAAINLENYGKQVA